MHTDANAAAPTRHLSRTPIRKVDRHIVGGITLYPDQLTKIDSYAKANGLSRSAAIRQLIDQHL